MDKAIATRSSRGFSTIISWLLDAILRAWQGGGKIGSESNRRYQGADESSTPNQSAQAGEESASGRRGYERCSANLISGIESDPTWEAEPLSSEEEQLTSLPMPIGHSGLVGALRSADFCGAISSLSADASVIPGPLRSRLPVSCGVILSLCVEAGVVPGPLHSRRLLAPGSRHHRALRTHWSTPGYQCLAA